MKTCYIIDGEKEHPHDNIPEKCLQTIEDSKIVFSYIKNDNRRSIINIMREEVYGIHDFILIINDIPYSIDHTVYNTIIKNENNAVYEFLTFYRKEEQV